VFAVILIDEANLPHERALLLAVVATVGMSVYAHGLSARPLIWSDLLSRGTARKARVSGPSSWA